VSLFSDYVSGVSFSDEKAQLVVVEIQKRSFRLRHASEYRKESDDPHWFLGPLFRRESKIMKKVKKVSVALDNTAVFLHSFPTDSTLSQVDMNAHLAWELAQFVPGYEPKAFVNDLHVLQTHAQEKVTEVFVVTAQRSLVRDLQQALLQQKFQLGLAETNTFGAEYAFAASYPEMKTKKVALVGVTAQRTDLAIVTHGRLTSYRYQRLSESEVLDFLAPHLQTETVSHVFFFGTAATAPLANNARGRFGVEASLLNPFNHIDIKHGAAGLDQYTGQEHIFAAAIGCALRTQ